MSLLQKKEGRKTKLTAATIVIITLALLLMTTAPMLAAAQSSPRFVRQPTIVDNSDFSLTANFRAVGLGNEVTDIFLTSSGGIADLQCVNPDGVNPPPKRIDFSDIEGDTIELTSRGQIRASPTLEPPPLPGAAELCPEPTWDVDILSIIYFDVELHIQQGGSDVLTFDFGDVDA